MIACQTLCFADYKDIKIEHSRTKDRKNKTIYEGKNSEDIEIAIILDKRKERPTSDLIKYVFSGPESELIEFETKKAKITFRTDLTGNTEKGSVLVVWLLDENDSRVKLIALMGRHCQTYNNFNLKAGNYKIEIAKQGPGDWKIWVIAPKSASFSSSRVEEKSLFFEAE
jgi:hypothetical protein